MRAKFQESSAKETYYNSRLNRAG